MTHQEQAACRPLAACNSHAVGDDLLAWFDGMIQHCLDFAIAEHAKGRPIVGILCEFTPRELIMAAGAVPVCLCGGAASTIPAAEEDLPANLCPLIKSTYGYSKLGTNPFLELASLIVAETTCDGKKKMYELLRETRPMYVLELPTASNKTEALVYWERELRVFKAHLEMHFSAAITDEALRLAIGAMNRERGLRRRLAELMKRDCPPITGRQLLALKSSISCIPADLAQYEEILAEVGSRSCWRKGPGDSPVRVLLTGVPVVHGAERVVDLIEASGGLVVCMENCTGLKPILDDVAVDDRDPLTALAEKYYHLPCSVMTANDARLDLLRRLADEYRPECVIDLIWHACLTYSVESKRVERMVEEEIGLPFLRIETDYSPSDSARIQVRIEALFENALSRRTD